MTENVSWFRSHGNIFGWCRDLARRYGYTIAEEEHTFDNKTGEGTITFHNHDIGDHSSLRYVLPENPAGGFCTRFERAVTPDDKEEI